ncbi:MacB-like periplasmic core domain protein [Gemmatirosa kalamazoonensis]|uniref:MacB-like periplasmic core domain protein n=1 Tax=Gemmatirosa kalamazoonensis TaxID=861299 RepID=W0RI28_9BACT|nr:ABC transporter permease [Gemmatirosa kalamazoonensis]AHG90436.1 MacB-like periplasmic core domain protein [Gemmatirosa kalamazoonensis]
MPFWEAVTLALQTIRVQKLKSFFTVLGVLIGVMFLIAVISIVQGMSNYMENDFAGKLIGANTFTVSRMPNFQVGDVSEAEWRSWQRRPRMYETDVRVIRSALPSGTPSAIEGQVFAYATSPYARRRQVQAVAADGDYFQIKKYNLTNGRAFTQQEAEMGARVLVIGTEVAEHFFPDLDPVGRELKISGMPYTIIGVIEKQGSVFGFSLDRLAIAPYHSPLARITNPQDDIDGLIVQAASREQIADLQDVVRETMRSRHRLQPAEKDDFALSSSESALAFFDEIKGKMTVFGAALPAIGMIVGSMVIMNIMLVAVAERTREIGIRKALGARRRDIMTQFLVEAATLSVIGAAMGISLGLVGAKLLSIAFPFLPAGIAPWSIGFALALGATVGVISGAYPASRASRLDPIAALRQE